MSWWSYRREVLTVMREYLMRIIFIILLADRREARIMGVKKFRLTRKNWDALYFCSFNRMNSVNRFRNANNFFCFRIAFCNLTWIVHFDNLQSWPNQNQLEHHRYKSLPTGGSDRKHLPFMRPKCTQFQIIPFSSRSKVNSLWFPAFVEWNSNEASLTAVASFTHSFENFPLSLPRRTSSCIDFILTLSIRRHNYYRHIENSHFFATSFLRHIAILRSKSHTRWYYWFCSIQKSTERRRRC